MKLLNSLSKKKKKTSKTNTSTLSGEYRKKYEIFIQSCAGTTDHGAEIAGYLCQNRGGKISITQGRIKHAILIAAPVTPGSAANRR
jgi:hypothetical protein